MFKTNTLEKERKVALFAFAVFKKFVLENN